MKHTTLAHSGSDWYIIMSVDGHGICDTSIYRVRTVRRWWQSKHEFFTDIVTCPESMDQQFEFIKKAIDKKLQEESSRNNFLEQYHRLEDLPFI